MAAAEAGGILVASREWGCLAEGHCHPYCAEDSRMRARYLAPVLLVVMPAVVAAITTPLRRMW